MGLWVKLLLGVLVFVGVGCGGSVESAPVETDRRGLPVESTSSTGLEPESSETTEVVEVSEEDLRDPVKQYKRYADEIDVVWSAPVQNLEYLPLFELVSESFAATLSGDIQDSVNGGEYYEIPPRSGDDIDFGEVAISGFYEFDEAGLPLFKERQTAQFKTCRVDRTVKKDSTGAVLDDAVLTYEVLVEMQFIDEQWKVNGREVLDSYKGEQRCEFLN